MFPPRFRLYRGRLKMVKAYLSSYRLGNHPETLTDLVGPSRRAALVFNAVDQYRETRLANWQREAADLENLGFACEELDLRRYFVDRLGLEERLRRST